MIPGFNNNKQITFEDPITKAEDFNEYFANIGEIAFKKSQEGLQDIPNNDIAYFYENSTSHFFRFRPQPVDINTVILTLKI